MPFQDIDETETLEEPRSPGTLERWARRVFVEELGLKLLALAITLVIWFAVTSENTPVTFMAAVQLNLLLPANLEVSNDPPRSINVLLNGSKMKLGDINSLDLVATVDLSDFKPGERVLLLTSQRVSMTLPEGVRIESFEPSSIPLRLEPRIERQLPVEVRVDGQPADGYEVYSTTSTPAAIKVQGPASHVSALEKAQTETVSVEKRTDSFKVEQVLIDIGSQKVEAVDRFVEVQIEIGEKRIERQFDNVQVQSVSGIPILPTVATVTLLGPVRAIEQLRTEDILVLVDKPSTGESNPQLRLPSHLQQQIKLVSIKPALFQ
jgi:YbbR domain-containing protein